MHRVFKKDQILTIPNLLSIVRLALIPLIVWLYVATQEYNLAVAVILLSGATDIVDGFIHSKTVVSDDTTATVGTTNFDFRSLYLHFECGALMYHTDAVMEVKEDFLETLKVCQEITPQDCKCSIPMRMFQDIMRLFAPLL